MWDSYEEKGMTSSYLSGGVHEQGSFDQGEHEEHLEGPSIFCFLSWWVYKQVFVFSVYKILCYVYFKNIFLILKIFQNMKPF